MRAAQWHLLIECGAGMPTPLVTKLLTTRLDKLFWSISAKRWPLLIHNFLFHALGFPCSSHQAANGQWRFIVTIVPWLEWWLGLSLASVTIPNSHLCDMMLISIPKTYAARPVLAVFGATFLERWRWLRERSNTQHVSLLSHLVGCHVRSHDNPWQPERSTGLHIKHISSMKRHWSQQLKTWNFQHKCSFKSSSKASHIQCTPDSSQ